MQWYEVTKLPAVSVLVSYMNYIGKYPYGLCCHRDVVNSTNVLPNWKQYKRWNYGGRCPPWNPSVAHAVAEFRFWSQCPSVPPRACTPLLHYSPGVCGIVFISSGECDHTWKHLTPLSALMTLNNFESDWKSQQEGDTL